MPPKMRLVRLASILTAVAVVHQCSLSACLRNFTSLSPYERRGRSQGVGLPVPWTQPTPQETVTRYATSKYAEQLALELIEEKSSGRWREQMIGPNGEDAESQVRRRFRLIRDQLGSDDELALEAFRRNVALWVFDEDNIVAASSVLRRRLGDMEALQVIRNNPAVLSIPASNLEAKEDLTDVKQVAKAVAIFYDYGPLIGLVLVGVLARVVFGVGT
eukprot:TRINITY_DN88111_c0_g1_i1.p1 TRINITY_DN88111_c0_g1~~TRINITY_DN88111_c0_g1_i1.p1  ORF type:complete len:217 (+),score=37.72 TRINITY_DN88111_c0_g1_i1:122-772(+)